MFKVGCLTSLIRGVGGKREWQRGGMIGLGLMLLILVLGLPLSVGAQVACGDTVGPNETKVLLVPLNCSDDPVVNVKGPATLDLNGLTITCDNTGQDGIVLQDKGAKVLNGVVEGCAIGVNVQGGKNHRIEGIVAKDNGQHGFFNDAKKSMFKGNTASNNTEAGFVNKKERSKYIHNMAIDNGKEGFRNDDGGSKSTYMHNTAIGNNKEGFDNVNANKVTYKNNTASRNTDQGFNNDHGNNVTYQNNTANDNDQGLRNDGGLNSTYKKNVALGNDTTDLVDSVPNCNTNVWQDNLFGESSDGGTGCIQ